MILSAYHPGTPNNFRKSQNVATMNANAGSVTRTPSAMWTAESASAHQRRLCSTSIRGLPTNSLANQSTGTTKNPRTTINVWPDPSGVASYAAQYPEPRVINTRHARRRTTTSTRDNGGKGSVEAGVSGAVPSIRYPWSERLCRVYLDYHCADRYISIVI